MRFTFFLRSFLAAVCPLWIILTRWVKCESMWPFLATLKLALSPWQPAQKLPQCPPRRQIPLTLLRLLPIWEALKKWKWVTSTPAVNLWLSWGYFSVAALMWCVCNPFKRTLEAAAESGVRGSDWKQEKKTMCWIRQTEVEHFLYVCVCVCEWCMVMQSWILKHADVPKKDGSMESSCSQKRAAFAAAAELFLPRPRSLFPPVLHRRGWRFFV